MPVDFGIFLIFWIPERRGVAVFWLNWLTLEDSGKFGNISTTKKSMSCQTPVDFGTFWVFWIPERRGVAVFWLNWLTLEDSGKSGKISKK